MKANETVIWSILQCLRGSALQELGALETALQLLTWAKLSYDEAIPGNLRLTEKTRISSDEELWSIFAQLSEIDVLGDNQAAFHSFLGIRGAIENKAISSSVEIAHKFAQSGKIEEFEVPESCYYNLSKAFTSLLIPSEIADLMVALADKVSNKRVYCPYDPLCFLARRADKEGASVYGESRTVSPIPWLINILSGANIQMYIGDPVKQPYYLTKNGKLEQFDVTIAFPPMGTRYEAEVVDHDWFSRFLNRTSSGSVLQIQHILAQTTERAVVAVSNSVLFSRGAEHTLRQDLAQRGVVEAVIGMPPAMLPFTAIPFSILVLNPRGGIKNTRFVDGSNERFYERDGRSRSRLIDWKELYNAFLHSTDEAIAVDVPVEGILKKDAYLEVSRYVRTSKQKQVEQLLKNSNAKRLDELVTFIRPSTKIQGESNITALEVNVADFPRFGYLAIPQRTVTLAKKELAAKEADTFLKPGDIIIAIKGSVGSLAIAPDWVPTAGEGGWLVNQSCLILRSNGQLSPKVLFMYLCSEIGQTVLKTIVSGATIRLIQLRSLKNLQVVIPSAQKAQSIEKAFDTQVEIQEKIEELRQEQYKLSNVHWEINGVEIGD